MTRPRIASYPVSVSLEKTEVLAALRRHRRISDAAVELGASRRTLQSRMRLYGIPRGRAGRPRHALKRRHRAAAGLAAAVTLALGVVIIARSRKA